MVDILQILDTLPHRYPMLLVDRLLERSEDGRSCRGLKNVTINEPFFQGHYPGKPIMPGVLLMECMAQVGCAALMLLPEHKDKVPLIGGIDNAKFRRMVVPGDQLIVDVEILWIRGSIGKMKAETKVEGDVAASMEMTFVLRPREA